MKYIFSLEPVENVKASNDAGVTVYQKVAKLDEKGKPVLDADGKPEMVDRIQEMVQVVIPTDQRHSWYGTVEQYRRILQDEIRNNENDPKAIMALNRFDMELKGFRTNTGVSGTGGTDLNILGGLSKQIIKLLIDNNVGSVEELAELSDSQCQNMGMGMRRFRTMAQTYMQGRTGDVTKKLVADVENLRQEKEQTEAVAKAKIEELQRQISALQAQNAGKQEPRAVK